MLLQAMIHGLAGFGCAMLVYLIAQVFARSLTKDSPLSYQDR